MATRALIGTIETDAAGKQVLTSTYKHYDGYSENLGVGLNNFYDQTDAAIKISNQGYISYLNPETSPASASLPFPSRLLPVVQNETAVVWDVIRNVRRSA